MFIQVSKSTLRQHDFVQPGKYRIRESLVGGVRKFFLLFLQSYIVPSFVSRMVEQICGVTCSTSLASNGEIICTFSGSALDVLFLYITSQTKPTIKKGEAHTSAGTPKYRNLLVMTREDAQACLNIPF